MTSLFGRFIARGQQNNAASVIGGPGFKNPPSSTFAHSSGDQSFSATNTFASTTAVSSEITSQLPTSTSSQFTTTSSASTSTWTSTTTTSSLVSHSSSSTSPASASASATLTSSSTVSHHSVPARLIPALVIVPIIAVVLIAFGALCCVRRQRSKREAETSNMEQITGAALGSISRTTVTEHFVEHDVDEYPKYALTSICKGDDQSFGYSRRRSDSFGSRSVNSDPFSNRHEMEFRPSSETPRIHARIDSLSHDAAYYTGLDTVSISNSSQGADPPPPYICKRPSISRPHEGAPPSITWPERHSMEDAARADPATIQPSKPESLRRETVYALARSGSLRSVTSTLYSSNASIHEAEPQQVSHQDGRAMVEVRRSH